MAAGEDHADGAGGTAVNVQTLKNLPRKQWLIIIGAATALLSGVILYLLAGSLNRLGEDLGVPAFMRRAGNEQSLYAQIKGKEEAIRAQELIASKISERQAQLDSMKADIQAARKRLPTEAQKAEVRQLIEDLGRQVDSALTVTSVSIREAAGAKTPARGAAGDYTSIEYQTTVSADMDGIIEFINLVERNERFMTVEGLQLTSGGVTVNRERGKIENKPHTAQLRIVTYIDSAGDQAGARRN
jgi:hypothetical protein